MTVYLLAKARAAYGPVPVRSRPTYAKSGVLNLRGELAMTFGQTAAGARTAAAIPMLID